VAGWEGGTIKMFPAETCRIALHGDAEEICWKVMAEVHEVVGAVAPDTDARFPTTHDEMIILIFVQKCEDWQRSSQGEGGSPGPESNADSRGGTFAGTYIYPDISGEVSTLRHEFGHLTGLNHPDRSDAIMTVDDPQAPQFGFRPGVFAVHANSRTSNRMNAQQAATAFEVFTQGDLIAIQQQHDVTCASTGRDFKKLASNYLAIAQSNSQWVLSSRGYWTTLTLRSASTPPKCAQPIAHGKSHAAPVATG
jgi:hypothetical protein